MTVPEPLRPGSGLDLARVALRRAKEDARNHRFTKTTSTASAQSQVRRGRTPSVPICRVLLDMFTERGLLHPVEASMMVKWSSVAGPVARHVVPYGFDQDTATLTLRCDSAA